MEKVFFGHDLSIFFNVHGNNRQNIKLARFLENL